MADVIFNRLRHAAKVPGLAEVTMHFDTANATLPIDAEEVQIRAPRLSHWRR